MIKHLVYLSFLCSNSVYSIHLKYQDEDFLSSNTPAAWECFLRSSKKTLERFSEIGQYFSFSDNISKLPFRNSVLIHPNWLLSTKPSRNKFLCTNLINYPSGIPIGENGGKVFLDHSIDPIEHPTVNLCLIKIKPTNLIPVERSCNLEDHKDPNIPKIFFSRTIHHGTPSTDPYNMKTNMCRKINDQGLGNFLNIEADFGYYNQVRYRFQKNFNLAVRTYAGDEGNPIFALHVPDNDSSKSIDFENPYKHARVIGIASVMYGEYFMAINITKPQIKAWIDQVILSDGLIENTSHL